MTEETNNHIINNSEDKAQAEQVQAKQTQAEQVQAQQPQTAQQQQQSYAVRPDHRHHRRLAYSDQNEMLPLRNKLNIGFMLLAIVGIILWTQLEGSHTPAVVVLIIAVVLKIAEVCIRLFKK